MKALTADDRPREKLARLGADALGDNELAAIVLGHGPRRRERARSRQRPARRARRHSRADAVVAGRAPARARHRPVRAPRSCWRPSSWAAGRCCAAGRAAASRSCSPRDTAAYLHAALQRPAGRALRPGAARRPLPRDSDGAADGRAGSTPRRCTRGTCFARRRPGVRRRVVLFHNHPSGDPAPSHDDVRAHGADAAGRAR